MKKVANEAAVRAGKPGYFAFEDVIEGEEQYRRMWVHLPCGFVGAFNLDPTPKSVPFPWPWNKSETKPTIERPIRIREQWHGRIIDGRMISEPAIAPPAPAPAITNNLPPPLPASASTTKNSKRAKRR